MAAPVEDTDMDLVAERLVLLSLPVKERWFTDQRVRSSLWQIFKRQRTVALTFSLCSFVRVELPFTLLALQLFLTTKEILLK